MALLLACARTSPDADAVRRLCAPAQPAPDWARLLVLAEQHGVTPLLARALSSVCPQLVPGATLAGLKTWQHANSLRSLTLTRDLLRVVRALEARGLRALPYKGPVLAEMAYGDLALRHCVDLDVLVPANAVPSARQVMEQLGYALTPDALKHEAAYTHVHHHYAFAHGSSRTMIELHWRMVSRQFSLRLPFDDLWRRRVSSNLAGQPLRVPSEADMLLAVCIHGSMHGWKQIKHVCDVAELAQRQTTIAWRSLLTVARAAGAQRMLLLGLALAQSVLDAPTPDALRDEIAADETLAALCGDLRTTLLAGRVGSGEPDERSFYGYYTRLRERRRDRIEEGLRRLFIPNTQEWSAMSLPEPLSFLHYVARPLRLGARYAGARRWRRD